MTRFRLLLAAVGLLVLGLVLSQPARATLSTLQSQIAVTIIVNVTPSPLAYNQSVIAASDEPRIRSSISLKRATPSMKRVFEAQSLHFDRSGPLIVAQAKQSPILVQAEVTPNPKATLLYSNDNDVIVNAVAGSTVQVPCAFMVTVDTTKNWTLYHGVSNDFSTDFPGKDLGNNTYVATPKPTATPYVVYADDGKAWVVLATGNKATTYCVTLTLTVPAAVAGGTYTSNAVYTLYF